MARYILAAVAVALAAFLSLPGESPAQPPLHAATGGNKALMEDWTRKKQELRNRVCEDLRRKNLLPENGVVTFEAKVAPDPRTPGKIKTSIQSLTITDTSKNPHSKDARPSGAAASGARIPGGAQSLEETSFPEEGGTVRGSVVIIGGRLQGQVVP
jgi:hypothetical protein